MAQFTRRSSGPISVLEAAPTSRYTSTEGSSSYQRLQRRSYTTVDSRQPATMRPSFHPAPVAYEHFEPVFSPSNFMTLSPRRVRYAPVARSRTNSFSYGPGMGAESIPIYPPFSQYGYDPQHVAIPVQHVDPGARYGSRRRSTFASSSSFHEPQPRSVQIAREATDESHEEVRTRRRPSRSRSMSTTSHVMVERRFGHAASHTHNGPHSPGVISQVLQASMADEPPSEGVHSSVLSMLPREKYVEPSSDRNRAPDALSCMVCQSEFSAGEDLLRLPCLHAFHFECINKWLDTRNTCPLCRIDVAKEFENCIEATNNIPADT